nr:uncharacterized protein LOC112546943 [Pelodiscus sinensis]|eukprot:XP_025044009.1 uncharacterized protein LOC112546943 [Pelodiscus sinensis]
MRGGYSPVERGYPQPSHPYSILPTRSERYQSGLPQPKLHRAPRMGVTYGGGELNFPPVGMAIDRPLCFYPEHQMSPILLTCGTWQTLSWGCLPNQMDSPPILGLSSHTPHPKSSEQDPERQSPSHPDCAIMVSPNLVPIPSQASSPAPPPTTIPDRPTISGRRQDPASTTQYPASSRMASLWFSEVEERCSQRVKDLLLHSRIQSTRKTYQQKWTRFCHWCQRAKVEPCASPLNTILDYILDLKASGLSISSLRVHLSAIAAFHTSVDGFSIFNHPITKRFLKGLQNVYPPHKAPSPLWDLNLVLNCLTRPPFNPLATVPLPFLFMKVCFLLAITSVRRVSELGALMSEPPYTVFTKDRVILRPHPTFLPKVCTEFHLNKPIVLPTFFPKLHSSQTDASLHTLDIQRALAFFLERTKPFHKSERLISIAERSKGTPVSSQRISKWISTCIIKCHTLGNRPLQRPPQAHSTRATAASTAFLGNVPLRDIYWATTWSSEHTFAKHYAILPQLKSDSAVATAVLSTTAKQ